MTCPPLNCRVKWVEVPEQVTIHIVPLVKSW